MITEEIFRGKKYKKHDLGGFCVYEIKKKNKVTQKLETLYLRPKEVLDMLDDQKRHIYSDSGLPRREITP